MKQIRKRMTYANVMSSIAVFLVLGGGAAFAASQLGKNTVGAKQLKKNAVTAAKLKDGAVTTTKIADSAVNGAKVQDASLTGADINLSSLGTVPSATKATTATTATTSTTALKLSRVTVVRVDFTVTGGAGNNATQTATCPAGTQAISGGVRDDEFASTAAIVTSRPVIGEFGLPATGDTFNGWRGSVTNTGATALGSSVWAICVG